MTEAQMTAPQLDVRLLRRIVTLARTGSFTRAAERLGISQSVLTRSIQDAERLSGLRLFDRSPGRVHVTESARLIVDQAVRLVEDFDALAQSFDQAAQGQLARIGLGMAPSAAVALLPDVCSRLASSNMSIESFIPVRQPGDLLQLLQEGEIECMICPEGAVRREEHTRITKLGHLSLTLLVRPGHPAFQPGYRPAHNPGFPILTAAGIQFERLVERPPFPPYFTAFLRQGRELVVEDHQSLSLATERSDAVWVTSIATGMQALQQKRLVELLPPSGESRPCIGLVAHSLERRSLSPAMAAALKHVRILMRSLPDKPPQ